MKASHIGQQFEFNIEGRFLGFGYDGSKLKYLKVGLATEHFQIKLPKTLRGLLPCNLTPEAPIQVSGIGQLDALKGVLKLKAHEVHSLGTTTAPLTPRATIQSACSLEAPHKPETRVKILLCHKSGCQKRGSKQLSQVLEETLRDRHLHGQVEIQYTGCQKRCSSAPNVTFMPGKHHYSKVNPSKLFSLIDKHLNPL